MPRARDLNGVLGGKVALALVAAAAIFAGAHALAPAVASAERTNCTTEPQGCDGSSGGGGDAGSNYAWGWDPNLTSEPGGIDDPTKPDPSVMRALNGTQPILQALDPAYMDQLVKDGLVDRKLIRSTDFTGMIYVLGNDCERLSTMIGNLEHKVDSLSFALDQLQEDGAGAGPFRKSLRNARSQKHGRSVEYQVLECATVISLDGRD